MNLEKKCDKKFKSVKISDGSIDTNHASQLNFLLRCRRGKTVYFKVEMDTVELANVHYTLLQYVYDKKVLHLSCFNHVWEDFRTIHDDFQNFRPGLIAIKKIENWGDKNGFFQTN